MRRRICVVSRIPDAAYGLVAHVGGRRPPLHASARQSQSAMNTTNLFVELLVIGVLRLQRADEVADFRGLRRVPENDIGIVGRGGGKLYPADPEQSAKACLAQVDAANVRDADFVRNPVDDAVFDADSLVCDHIPASQPVNLNPANQQKGNNHKGSSRRPEHQAEVGQDRPKAGHDRGE